MVFSFFKNKSIHSSYLAILTLSWRRPLSYRNQSIDLQSKSMDWFLYDNGLRHERVNCSHYIVSTIVFSQNAPSDVWQGSENTSVWLLKINSMFCKMNFLFILFSSTYLLKTCITRKGEYLGFILDVPLITMILKSTFYLK